MSTVDTHPGTPGTAFTRRSPAYRVTQARVAVSEFTKLRSIRSTRLTLLAGIALTIAVPLIASIVTSNQWASISAHDKATFSALDTSLIGVNIAQLAIGVLGVVVITGEYSTGMIRATMSAVPKRLPVLWAKAAVFGLVTLVLTVPAVLIAFFASQAILSGHSVNGHGIALSISHSGVFRAVIGSALYLTLAGLLGLGLGAITRTTAAGISAFAALLFVLPPLVSILPASWDNAISPYLPSTAGQAIMKIGNPAHTLAPWTGLGLFAVYTALSIGVAALLLRRRDV
jgi:ABC-2 type transport system permease protein